MAIIMVSILTIYTNAAVIMIMAIAFINKFTHCMSIATKTMTNFLKKFKKTLFQDDRKRTQMSNFRFSFKNRSFFIILPTKCISLDCTAS